MTVHRGRLSWEFARWRALCECGWTSGLETTPDDARAAFDRHEEAR